MQSATRFAISIFLLTSALASSYQGTAKLRRDGILNLYPFPRVGRSSHHTWQLPLEDMYGTEFDKPSLKRQLMAFPRVGRNELSLLRELMRPGQWSATRSELGARSQPMELMKRDPAFGESETDAEGMWFGPRLGRAVKNDDEGRQLNNDHSEAEQIESLSNENRKKRQTNRNM